MFYFFHVFGKYWTYTTNIHVSITVAKILEILYKHIYKLYLIWGWRWRKKEVKVLNSPHDIVHKLFILLIPVANNWKPFRLSGLEKQRTFLCSFFFFFLLLPSFFLGFDCIEWHMLLPRHTGIPLRNLFHKM